MSKATNYFKARFSSAQAAVQALPSIRAFVREGIQARSWWQAHRHLERQGRRSDFWKQFPSRFPEACLYLGTLAGGNCDDALLGFLEFGAEEANEIEVDGEYLLFKAPGLWHSADWNLLAEY